MEHLEEKIMYQWKILEIVQKNVWGRILEIARRSPWVRLLILYGDDIYLTKERRQEHNWYDYRLPGGKVFDTLVEFKEALANWENILEKAEQAAKKESKEETGLIPLSLSYLTTSKAGATVEWDLYYFVVEEFKQSEQELEDWEDIVIEKFSREEVKNLCLNGEIREDRTVAVLLKFLLSS